MEKCSVCQESLAPDAKTCHVCGTAVVAQTVSAIVSPLIPAFSSPVPLTVPPASGSSLSTAGTSSSGERQCPGCQKHYGPGYADSFCECGTELRPATMPLGADGASGLDSFAAPPRMPQPASFGPITISTPLVPSASQRPPVGTVCLVLYSEQKQPLAYVSLDRDVTLIGRVDPVGGTFPDLDVSQHLTPDEAKCVSRKHCLVLRSRVDNNFMLRPLAKNTGTQIERELATDLQDYPLTNGTRIVLGGKVRMKFEILS